MKNKLYLGAGTDRFGDDWLHHDLLPLEGIESVHNLVITPYPWPDAQFTHISAIDVVEHLPNYDNDNNPMIIKFLEECHRLLMLGGELRIRTPRYDAEFLWIDPTHVRGFHEQSFDFFDPSKKFGQSTGFYSSAKFSVSVITYSNKNLDFRLIKL
jgi:predicted SAM-dependent methyltransferase